MCFCCRVSWWSLSQQTCSYVAFYTSVVASLTCWGVALLRQKRNRCKWWHVQQNILLGMKSKRTYVISGNALICFEFGQSTGPDENNAWFTRLSGITNYTVPVMLDPNDLMWDCERNIWYIMISTRKLTPLWVDCYASLQVCMGQKAIGPNCRN